MNSQHAVNLKLCMEESWYKEYWTFLKVPILATVACYFIPLFRCEQGMSFMAILPLTTAFSYGHMFSPRIQYYEKSWKQTMEYHDFILGTVKRALLFALPTVCITRIFCLFLQGYAKELALFFEVATYGLTTGIFICALLAYKEETLKLKKDDQESYKKKLGILWAWIAPSMIGFSLMMIFKSYTLLDLIWGRP